MEAIVFLLKFLCWSGVIFSGIYVTTAGIFYLRRIFGAQFERPAWQEAMYFLLATNNRRAAVLAGMTVIIFIIACFNFGEPVLWEAAKAIKKEVSSQPEIQRGWEYFLYGLYGKSPSKPVISTFVPVKSWFWWYVFFIYSVVSGFYGAFSFREEIAAGLRGMRDTWREHRDRRPPAPPVPPSQGGTSPPPASAGPQPLTFRKFWGWELIFDLASAFAAEFAARRWSKKS